MGIDLYYMLGSPPCHAALMTAEALEIKLNLKAVDLRRGEQFSPEYLKVNFNIFEIKFHLSKH